jgi:phage anti-repressor protein
MNQLIKITENNGYRAVSARELHLFLESNERFSKWIERMLEYSFNEDEDYTPYQNVHPQNHQVITDYALTLDTAKEIAMLQRCPKGKEARQYFIAMEKLANDKLLKAHTHTAKVKGKSSMEDKQDELLDLITFYLDKPDVKSISKKLGFSQQAIYGVLNKRSSNKAILAELYNTAVINKETFLLSYQQMIDSLKQ